MRISPPPLISGMKEFTLLTGESAEELARGAAIFTTLWGDTPVCAVLLPTPSAALRSSGGNFLAVSGLRSSGIGNLDCRSPAGCSGAFNVLVNIGFLKRSLHGSFQYAEMLAISVLSSLRLFEGRCYFRGETLNQSSAPASAVIKRLFLSFGLNGLIHSWLSFVLLLNDVILKTSAVEGMKPASL